MAILHFCHDHPLELRSVLSDSGAQCFICKKPVSGYNYKCPKCNFFLHIPCLKLPLESIHLLHQDHPLILLPDPPLDSDKNGILCNKCRSTSGGFIYFCELCSFGLHLQCSIEQYDLSFEVHKHPLTFSAWPFNGLDSFVCNLCGEYGFGFCLFCKNCQFVVHVECSPLPAKVRYGFHDYLLELVPVKSIEDGTNEFYCTVCEESVNVKGSIYYHAETEYIGHLGCIVSTSELHFKSSHKDVNVSSECNFDAGTDNVLEIHDQLGNDEDEELGKMRVRFRKLLKGNGNQSTGPLNLVHFSHDHPLIFSCDYQGDDTLVYYACWGRISRFAYRCEECSFFLHKWCAELPQKIKHPLHTKHPLSLLSREPSYGFGCDACGHALDGYTYTCKTCNFNLHAICASLPNILRNEIHQHPLILCRKMPYSSKCSCCKEDCNGTVFECEMCNLVLDFKCAVLPHRVKHNCHIDPLTLTFLNEDDEDEYYCYACEETRKPNLWVYYCAGCEFTAHLNCVVSELVGGPMKEGPVQFSCHEHLLGLITGG